MANVSLYCHDKDAIFSVVDKASTYTDKYLILIELCALTPGYNENEKSLSSYLHTFLQNETNKK
jgi:hypothetical protein